MSSSKSTRGKCAFCGRRLTGSGLIRHLRACNDREDAIAQANENNKKAAEQKLYHLQVKNAYNSDFWLHLEMNGHATMVDLDDFLRMIWLECCGHMSGFAIGNNPWGDEIPMNRKANQIIEKGMELTHTYDFGSSTHTSINVVDSRLGKPLSAATIFLMARNEMPEAKCDHCNKKAHWLIEDYESYENDEYLCEKHKQEKTGNEDEYVEGVLEFVNSPRFGVCGYTGPAISPNEDAKTYWD